jgi:ubiquinone/menaquinone biosynthesis C-methylase UbiE
MLSIKSTDRVLEIGSGNRPRKRADVLCDKYLDDNVHRGVTADIVLDKRPFVVADGRALPFKDKSFDFVFTSHILEHVDDPYAFVAELARVARGGYIETPSELGEKIFGWDFHQWIVRAEGDTLVMRRRTDPSLFGSYFHDLYAQDPFFTEFVDSHFGDFYVQYEWHGSIPLRIEADTRSAVILNAPSATVTLHSPLTRGTIAVARSLLRPVLTLLRHFRKFR